MLLYGFHSFSSLYKIPLYKYVTFLNSSNIEVHWSYFNSLAKVLNMLLIVCCYRHAYILVYIYMDGCLLDKNTCEWAHWAHCDCIYAILRGNVSFPMWLYQNKFPLVYERAPYSPTCLPTFDINILFIFIILINR